LREMSEVGSIEQDSDFVDGHGIILIEK
jgi:hypothetical protein